MIQGLVVGKFYPPHMGHHYLINVATANCDKLTVFVVDTPGQEISASQRLAWLVEHHPGVHFQVIRDIQRDNDSRAWAAYTYALFGDYPDVVFTSEDYGDVWVAEMDCQHFKVDPKRERVPISGTEIRDNPWKHWEYLAPQVRAHYALRVAVVGAESTGTTTLTEELAACYSTAWVPEYGRFYSEGKKTSWLPEHKLWKTQEFEHIIEMQNQMEDQFARLANKILFCDTNSLATFLWHRRYVGYDAPNLLPPEKKHKYVLYIITGDEIPFVQDGLRDGEDFRHGMHEQFVELVGKEGVPYLIARGSVKERVNFVTKYIKANFPEYAID